MIGGDTLLVIMERGNVSEVGSIPASCGWVKTNLGFESFFARLLQSALASLFTPGPCNGQNLYRK